MKNLSLCMLCVIALAACKRTEEVKIDSTEVDVPADSIVVQDTVASITENSVPMIDSESRASISETSESNKASTSDYIAFGSKIAANNAIGKDEMLRKYQNLKKGDTIDIKFKSTIKSVCKKKGCWMAMELPNEKESFVRFKDYGFFVPLNADNSEAIVSGKAFVDVISVAELQHYAKDGGKSQDEIDKITEPKVTYAFQADGVLIKE